MGHQLRLDFSRAAELTRIPVRIARCPACGHEGAIPKTVDLGAWIRCNACGQRLQVRQAVGPRPARFHTSTKKTVGDAIAQEVFERYGAPALDDSIDDLWR